jgi:hypothetical protein
VEGDHKRTVVAQLEISQGKVIQEIEPCSPSEPIPVR